MQLVNWPLDLWCKRKTDTSCPRFDWIVLILVRSSKFFGVSGYKGWGWAWRDAPASPAAEEHRPSRAKLATSYL